MTGAKVNNYAIGDSDIEAVMLTTDQIYKGQCKVSLTEMSTTTVPKIAAGSWVENNGTLFKFDSDETLTGSPSNGIVYIRIVPSTDSCTAEMTNTAPTWSNSKQGWYGTGGSANYRYIAKMNKSSSSYTGKMILENYYASIPQGKFEKVILLASVSGSISYNTASNLSTVVSTTLDTHSALSSSGVFTVPVKGVYRVMVDGFNLQYGNDPWMWRLIINGSTGGLSITTNTQSTDGADLYATVNAINITKSYNVGDTIYLQAIDYYAGGPRTATASYFAIELLYPL